LADSACLGHFESGHVRSASQVNQEAQAIKNNTRPSSLVMAGAVAVLILAGARFAYTHLTNKAPQAVVVRPNAVVLAGRGVVADVQNVVPKDPERMDTSKATQPNSSQLTDSGVNGTAVGAVHVNRSTLTDPDSVKGRQFALSASVQERCKKADTLCDWMGEQLVQFAAQPRDPTWASATEQSIQDALVADGRVESIRALECRESLCAVEVTSLETGALEPPQQFYRDNRLLPGRFLFVSEVDGTGTPVHASVMTFVRR
jgi:hypothetical protein